MNDMYNPNGGSPVDGTARRHLLKGAVWSVPMFATAVAAPMAIASPPCPSVGQQANWTGPVTTAGSYAPQTNQGNGNYWRPISVAEAAWYSGAENASQTSRATHYIQSSFEARAGVTYQFSVRVLTSAWNQRPQGFVLFVGGEAKLTLATGAAAGTTPALSGYTVVGGPSGGDQIFTFTYTPQTSGAKVIRYQFTNEAVIGTTLPNGANADMRVALPTLICAP